MVDGQAERAAVATATSQNQALVPDSLGLTDISDDGGNRSQKPIPVIPPAGSMWRHDPHTVEYNDLDFELRTRVGGVDLDQKYAGDGGGGDDAFAGASGGGGDGFTEGSGGGELNLPAAVAAEFEDAEQKRRIERDRVHAVEQDFSSTSVKADITPAALLASLSQDEQARGEMFKQSLSARLLSLWTAFGFTQQERLEMIAKYSSASFAPHFLQVPCVFVAVFFSSVFFLFFFIHPFFLSSFFFVCFLFLCFFFVCLFVLCLFVCLLLFFLLRLSICPFVCVLVVVVCGCLPACLLACCCLFVVVYFCVVAGIGLVGADGLPHS